MDYFSKEEADVIGEISNISIGSSATAMNMMLGQPITITTPEVSLVHKTEILNDYEKSCVLIRVQYTQGLYGNNILILKDSDFMEKVCGALPVFLWQCGKQQIPKVSLNMTNIVLM